VLLLDNNLLTNIKFLGRLWAPKLIELKLSKNKIQRVERAVFRESQFPDLEQIILSK
jgi:hypothetical protein